MTDEQRVKYSEEVLERLMKYKFIRTEEIPNIDLYMDQVTTFMDEHLASLKRHEDDKLLTKMMINNYTKNKLLPPPKKKKYSRDHMMELVFIYYFKSILSIGDIEKVMAPLTEHFFAGKDSEVSLERIYNEVFGLGNEVKELLYSDVAAECDLALGSFADLPEGEKKDFLQIYVLTGLLCLDIFVKKSILESMIDMDIFSRLSDMEEGEKKSSKKGESEGK